MRPFGRGLLLTISMFYAQTRPHCEAEMPISPRAPTDRWTHKAAQFRIESTTCEEYEEFFRIQKAVVELDGRNIGRDASQNPMCRILELLRGESPISLVGRQLASMDPINDQVLQTSGF